MATLQEALKLKKEKGISTRDAIAQIEGNTSTQKPAITPTTPPPTITTQQFPSQPIDQQTVSGVNGETFQVAPVNQQGVTPQAQQSVAPIQPVTPNTPHPTQNVTPTPTATPEKKIVAPQVDFNVSQGREGEIQKNIADITATNPTLLKDRNAFNQAFGYTTADQGKKAILDSAFQSGQPQIPNADQMFSSIVMKAPVPDDQKTTTQYKIAQNRYLKANSYASMTPAQVSSDITSGKLIEGSQTYEDIKALNPKLIQDTNNLRIVNGSKVSLYSTDTQGNKINNVEQSFTEDYLGNFGTFLKSLFTVQTPEQIQAIIRTDEVKDAEAKADEYERELNAIEEGGLEIEKRVRKELEGTGASSERIRLEIAIAQEENDKKYNSVLKKYTQFANKANNLMTQNTAAYQESQKQKTAQQQALAGAAGQVFSNEMQKENTLQQQQNARENMLLQESLAQSRASFQTIGDKVYKVQNGQMTDTGIKAEKDAQYQSYGGKLYKIKGDSVTEVPGINTETPKQSQFTTIGYDSNGKAIMGFVNELTGTVSPYNVTGDLRNLASQFPGQAWAKNNNPAGITWNANFDKGTGTAKLFADAGIQFSKGTARPANEGGNYVSFNTIEDGLKAQQILMTKTYGNSTVGDMLASWVGTTEGPNYAKQVAGMAGITDLNAKVSSLSSEQVSALQMAKIKKESPGLYGILSKGEGTAVSSDAQNYFNLIQKGTTSYEDVFKKLGGSKVGQALMNEINSLIAAKGGAIPAPPDSEQVKKMDDLIGRLNNLLEEDGNKLESVSGLTYGSLWDKTFGYSKEQALGNLKFVLKGNTLQQLIDAKAQGATFGALSNEELRMLQESASPILAFAQEDEKGNIKGFRVDEATLKNEVKKLRDLFTEKRAKMVNPGINQGIMMPNQEVAGMQGGTGAGQVNYVSPTGKTYSF